MSNCPVCGKLFPSQFAMNGHLRLSNDNLHVAYTGKTTSRKPKHEPSENLSKQTYDVLLERISSLEAKLDAQNKPQQQPMTKTEIPVTSAYQSPSTAEVLLRHILKQEAKDNAQNKPPQQIVIKTETPAVPTTVQQPKPIDWREYIKTAEPSTNRDDYFYSDKSLNKMVKDGRSPEYVRDHAEEKTFSARQKDDDDEE